MFLAIATLGATNVPIRDQRIAKAIERNAVRSLSAICA